MISKVAIQAGLGVTAVGGVAGAVTYALWDSSVEYLVEVKSAITGTIKGGNDNNYFCQWDTNNTDNQCKLIKLTFQEKQSLNLEKIKTSNEEITGNANISQNTWLKLKISKNYEFKVENSTEIQIVQKDSTSTIFTTLTPKFKISTLSIKGKANTFLMKLSHITNQTNISGSSFECKWINAEQVKTITSNWTAALTGDTATDLSTCKVYKFETQHIPTNWKTNGFNLTNASEIQISSINADIKKESPGPYYIINFTTANNTNAKSMSEQSNLVVVYVESTNKKPVGVFSIESSLAGKVKSDITSSNLIILN